MKRILLLLLTLTSCTLIESPINPSQNKNLSLDRYDYTLNENDIAVYLSTIYPQTKSAVSIKPYTVDNDTVMFEVRLDGKFKLFTADKRLPIILAFNDKTDNIDISSNPALKTWIDIEAKNIQYFMKNYKDSVDNQNTRIWNKIFSKYIGPQTKAEGDPDEEEGYWRWISCDTTYMEFDDKNHLINTHWHQANPYNSKCPTIRYSAAHTPAGCVAVAGAQMLNFLYHKYGVPEEIPGEYKLNGWSTSAQSNDYRPENTTKGSTYWTNIQNMDSLTIASLIAWIGYEVDTEYTSNESYAYTSDLENFFEDQGIYCTYSQYSGTTALQSIRSRMPVIISGRIFQDGVDVGGHAFIADRYRIQIFHTEDLYEYVPHYNGGVSTGETKIVTDEVYDYYLGMNFGWENPIYDETFVSTATWDFYNFDIPYENRYMIHNFRVN